MITLCYNNIWGGKMEKIKVIFIKAFKSTASTILKLAKIVIPVVFVLTFINMIGVIDYISNIFAPFMQIFNLPGEASVPIILGGIVNLYAAISAIETMNLDSAQITTISIMLLIAHSLILETAVIATLKVKKTTQLSLRIGVSIIVGIIIGAILGGLL